MKKLYKNNIMIPKNTSKNVPVLKLRFKCPSINPARSTIQAQACRQLPSPKLTKKTRIQKLLHKS